MRVSIKEVKRLVIFITKTPIDVPENEADASDTIARGTMRQPINGIMNNQTL